ncbi:MAG: hypothetical protein DYH08_04820 [Actinobacteria bacterium ATB1]|nr:hypothetical protein [Actinobacteria bacterium ATB1]
MRSRNSSSPTLADRSSPASPGIGPRTGPRILVEIGDGSQFPTDGHLSS